MRERFLGYARNDTVRSLEGRKVKRAGGMPTLQNAKETADPSYRLARDADEFGMTALGRRRKAGKKNKGCRPEGRRYECERAGRMPALQNAGNSRSLIPSCPRCGRVGDDRRATATAKAKGEMTGLKPVATKAKSEEEEKQRLPA